MPILILAFLAGFVAGLRSMTPLAIVSWVARFGRLDLTNTWFAFLGFTATPYLLSLLAVGELIADKLPETPSRKTFVPFAGRIGSGAICGAAIGHSGQALAGGMIAGAAGAIAGTLGGYQLRVQLARAAGRDLTAALAEDAIALCIAAVVVIGIG
jgi:uncharacterized membrane protein